MLSSSLVLAQDAYFSNNTDASLFQNPAQVSNHFYGKPAKAKVSLAHRDQWSNIANNAFKTTLLQGDMTLSSSSMDAWNAGALFLNDASNNGLFRINTTGVSAAYTRALMKTRQEQIILTAGSSISYNQTNVNSRDLWFGRQYDQSNLEIDRSIDSGEAGLSSGNNHISLDCGLNFLYNSNKLEIGISSAVFHLNNPSLSQTGNEQISRRLNNRLMVSFKPNKTLKHTVFLNSFHQSPGHQLTGGYGMNFSINDEETLINISFGLRMVNNIDGFGVDSGIVNFGLDFRTWGAYLSYDINVSDLNNQIQGTGALELGIAYYIQSEN